MGGGVVRLTFGQPCPSRSRGWPTRQDSPAAQAVRCRREGAAPDPLPERAFTPDHQAHRQPRQRVPRRTATKLAAARPGPCRRKTAATATPVTVDSGPVIVQFPDGWSTTDLDSTARPRGRADRR